MFWLNLDKFWQRILKSPGYWHSPSQCLVKRRQLFLSFVRHTVNWRPFFIHYTKRIDKKAINIFISKSYKTYSSRFILIWGKYLSYNLCILFLRLYTFSYAIENKPRILGHDISNLFMYLLLTLTKGSLWSKKDFLDCFPYMLLYRNLNVIYKLKKN